LFILMPTATGQKKTRKGRDHVPRDVQNVIIEVVQCMNEIRGG